jgi:cell division control protein 11
MAASQRARGRNKVKKGLTFTLMVVGSSGTGKTTFVNTLCGKPVLEHKEADDPENAHVEHGVRIKPVTVGIPLFHSFSNLDLEEEGTRIALTVVDTPGFGDQIDNEACFAEVAGYLERQYDDILAEESRIKRNPRFRDNRVHALLYFITPTGHGYIPNTFP